MGRGSRYHDVMASFFTRRAALGVLAAAPLTHPAWGASPLPRVTITKDPTCGCCAGWADHVRAAGFPVEVIETGEINRIKVRLGVPSKLYACHTAEVDGYVLEGHVPASMIQRLLAERPKIKGLAVPGMPAGSPGMEVDGAAEPYEVIAFGPSGHSVFARFKGSDPL